MNAFDSGSADDWGGANHPGNAADRSAPGEDLLIDCDSCQVRPQACGDCVVSVLLGPIDDEAMVWDAEERRAMAVLADSGLVPRLRLVSSDQGPDGQAVESAPGGQGCPQDLVSEPPPRHMLG